MTSCDCSKILLFKKLIFYFLNWTANAHSGRLGRLRGTLGLTGKPLRFIFGLVTFCPLRDFKESRLGSAPALIFPALLDVSM